MQQIKVKELPEDYLVLDYWVPSGNNGFINVDIEKEGIGWSNEIDCFVYENDDWADINDDEVQRLFGLGTKHIRLVAANPKVHLYRYEIDFSFGTEQREEYGFFNISELGYQDDRYNDKDTFWIDNEVANDEIVEKELLKLSKEQYDLAKSFEQQGKDFFIYKVSEEK